MRSASFATITALPLLLQLIFGAVNAFGGEVFLDAQHHDPRQNMTSSAMPWSSIGLVWSTEMIADAQSKKMKKVEDICTGTLIGKRLVLTAAHCVVKLNSDPSLNTIKLVSFSPNYQGGSPGETSSAAQEKIAGNTTPKILTIAGTLDPNKDPANDWAIIVLENDLGNKYGYMDTESTSDLTLPVEVQFAGYSADRRDIFEGASFVSSCQILSNYSIRIPDLGISEKILQHNCSAMEGASGGPLFHIENGKYTITAVNVRGDENTTIEYSLLEANLAVWNDALIQAIQAAKLKYEP